MVSTSLILLAASSIVLGAPIVRRADQAVKRSTAYSLFGGDGSESQGWPSQKNWVSFEQAWNDNVDVMAKSCSQFTQKENSQQEISDIKKAIESVASESNLPKEFLLAVMMQESKGCVRAPTTSYGQTNPGLMQSFNGAASCFGKDTCDASTIKAMISEGAGIGLQFGLMQALEQGGGNYFKAARIYNSGSVAPGGNLGAGIATHCYASDIANRMMGWADAKTTCDETKIASVQGNTGNANSNPAPSPTQAPAAPSATGAPTFTEPPSAQPIANTPAADEPKKEEPKKEEPKTEEPKTEEPSKQQPGSSSAPKIQDKADCKTWHEVQQGEDCSNIPAANFDTLRTLNPMIDSNCSNLWLGYQYCIA